MNYKKTAAILLAMLISLPVFTGCGREIERQGATLEVDLTKSYRSEQILNGDAGYPLGAFGNYLLYEYYNKNKDQLYCYNAQTGEAKELKLSYQKRQPVNTMSADAVLTMPGNKLGVLIMDYERDSGWRPTNVKRVIEVFDEQLKPVEIIEVPEGVAEDYNLWENSVAVDDDGNYFISYRNLNDEVILEAYDSSFRKYGNVRLPSGFTLQYLVRAADGTVCASLEGQDISRNTYKFVRLHAADRSSEEINAPIHTDMLRNVCTGTNGYDFYYYDDDFLWGVKGNTTEEIINWTNSDFPNGIHACKALENGQFIAYPFSFTNQSELWLLNKRTEQEIENMQLLTLATLELPMQLEMAVAEHNRQSTDYRIYIHDYAKYNEDPYDNNTGGMDKFKEDMLSGVVADMICTDNLNFDSLANKGLFEDWYGLMQADEEFNKEDYLTNFFESYQSGKKLLRLGVDFSVSTAIAKTKYVGKEQGITPSELMELSKTLPEGMTLYEIIDREILVTNYLHGMQNTYIDREKAKCYYNTQDFKDMLTLFASLPDNYRSRLTELCYRNDKVLLYRTSIGKPIDYHTIARTTFLDEEFTLIGNPTHAEEGNGGVFGTSFTLSLNTQSTQQEAAWEFMKYLLSPEYQRKFEYTMPVHLPTLEKEMVTATKQTMAKAYFNGTEVNIGAATEDEMAILMDYIKGIKESYFHDTVVYNILMEETEKLLAGDCTVDAAAEMIQSRVSLYLSEQS